MEKLKNAVVVILVISLLGGIAYGLYRLSLYFASTRPVPTIYTVTFDAHGGRFLDDTTVKELQTDRSGKLAEFPVPQRYNYTLVGWSEDPLSDNALIIGSTPDRVFTSDITLYAQWYSFPIGDGNGDGDNNGGGGDGDDPGGSPVNPNPSPGDPSPIDPTPGDPDHVCESKCGTCGKCINYKCKDTVCADKCTGHDEQHYCQHKCEVCGRCLTDCREKYCASKCMGHDPHLCESKCAICGRCTNLRCNGDNCKNKCNGHEHKCQSKCSECGKCTNTNCTESVCADKCAGHEPEEHKCKSECLYCGGCYNTDCTEDICKEKCPGHESDHECLSVCPICNACYNEDCKDINCFYKCSCNFDDPNNYPVSDYPEDRCEHCGICSTSCVCNTGGICDMGCCFKDKDDPDYDGNQYSCGCTHVDDGCNCAYGYACEFEDCGCTCHDRMSIGDEQYSQSGCCIDVMYYDPNEQRVEWNAKYEQITSRPKISLVFPNPEMYKQFGVTFEYNDPASITLEIGFNGLYSVDGLTITSSKGLRLPYILEVCNDYESWGLMYGVTFSLPPEFWENGAYYIIYPQISYKNLQVWWEDVYDPNVPEEEPYPVESDPSRHFVLEEDYGRPDLLALCSVKFLGYTKTGLRVLIYSPDDLDILYFVDHNGEQIEYKDLMTDGRDPRMAIWEFPLVTRPEDKITVMFTGADNPNMSLGDFGLDGYFSGCINDPNLTMTVHQCFTWCDNTEEVYIEFTSAPDRSDIRILSVTFYDSYDEPVPLTELSDILELYVTPYGGYIRIFHYGMGLDFVRAEITYTII